MLFNMHVFSLKQRNHFEPWRERINIPLGLIE